MGLAFPRKSCEEEKEPTSWRATELMKDWLSQRDLKVLEKSTEAGLRTAKQSDSRTDHLNRWPGHHSLRCLAGWGVQGAEAQTLEVSSWERTGDGMMG